MASYDDILWDEYRCRRCNFSWRTEADRQQGRGRPWRDSRAMRPSVEPARAPQPDEVAFHHAMVAIYDRAKSEVGYTATRFRQLVSRLGGVKAARHLLAAPHVSDGFATLWEKGRLDLSVEAHVLQRQYLHLFSVEERDVALRRLQEHGYGSAPSSRGDTSP